MRQVTLSYLIAGCLRGDCRYPWPRRRLDLRERVAKERCHHWVLVPGDRWIPDSLADPCGDRMENRNVGPRHNPRAPGAVALSGTQFDGDCWSVRSLSRTTNIAVE